MSLKKKVRHYNANCMENIVSCVRSAKKMWIVWFAIILHFVWGVMLLLDPHTANVTCLHDMVSLFSGSHKMAGLFSISASILTIWSIFLHKSSLFGLLLIIPQQFLMVISANSALHAILSSSFADGVIRPVFFIAADQSPAIIAMLMHTFCLIDHYAGFSFRRKNVS